MQQEVVQLTALCLDTRLNTLRETAQPDMLTKLNASFAQAILMTTIKSCTSSDGDSLGKA